MNLCFRLTIAAFVLTVSIYCNSLPHIPSGYTPALQAPSDCASKAHRRSLVIADRKENADVATHSVAAAPTGSTEIHTTVSLSEVQLAPVSNQSADASAAIIASISLHGQGLVPFGQKQRQVLMSALSATVTASTRMALTSMQVLSISEFVPNNTTSSPAPSRRLRVKRPRAGRRLQQDAANAYVEAQIAIVTSGNMATSLQMQLNQTILEPQRLLTALQQTGLAVTDITLRSLDVEEPPDPGLLIGDSVSETSLSPVPQPIPLVTTAAAQTSAFSKTALGVILGIGIPLTLGVGVALCALLSHRKRPYSAYPGSLQGDFSTGRPHGDGSMTPSHLATTSNDDSPRHSLDMRRVHSETLCSKRSLIQLGAPFKSMEGTQMPMSRTAQHLLQHREQTEQLGCATSHRSSASRVRKGSGELSMAARVELVAAQVKDEESMAPGDENLMNSLYGGSTHWRSTNTSSSSQNQTIQRLTRLDTTAWQIPYSELKFSRLIGEGSFGRVFLGKWRETTVAIKLLSRKSLPPKTEDSGSGDPEYQLSSTPQGCKAGMLEDLDKEAAIMAALRHPNVVMFLGVCLDPPCVVAEYCARGSLHDVLIRARRSKTLQQQLDWVRRINMALDAAKGMLYLHMCQPPILHRDLKSANLLVSKHWKVKVADFNLSRVMEASSMQSSLAATNPRWIAPEVLAGSHYGRAADVYAFGVILWEILTWEVPWDDLGPWQIVIEVADRKARPEVPDKSRLPGEPLCLHTEYVELMEECWAQDPAARPSFEVVIGRLRAIIDAETSLSAQQTQHRNSRHSPFPANRSSLESQRSSCEEQRGSGDGSQAGRVSHRLSRESSSANALPLSCRHSLEAPSLGRRASTTITEGLLASVTESETPLLPEQQREDVLSATRAAQALVEEAHREIEMSGIRPVYRLASLDTNIPLSLLRLSSDPINPPPLPDDDADLEALTINTQGLLNNGGGRAPPGRPGRRKVSWPSQQLAQVMSNVAQQKQALMGSLSTEAVAGSPEKDRDRLSLDLQGPDAVSFSSGTTSRRSGARMVSPFALTTGSSQFG